MGAERTYKQAETHGCMMNLICVFSLYHLVRSKIEDNEGAQAEGYRPSGQRQGSRKKRKGRNKYMYANDIKLPGMESTNEYTKHEREDRH